MTENTWEGYYNKTKNQKPRPLLVEAIRYIKDKNYALDLGSGAFNDVSFLVSEGFKHITAVDYKPLANDIIENFPTDTVEYVISNFEDFSFGKEKYDLINAQYSLPFNPKSTFSRVFDSITESLKSGGIFTGQLFGIKDEWNRGDDKMNFHTREQAEEMLSKFKMIKFTEEESDKNTATGDMKHWHVFHFIIRK